MVHPHDRFSQTVGAYEKFRPSYPSALIDWIVGESKLKRSDRVLDLGCGTGIASRLFFERGFSVIGVDPNPAMLDAARATNGAIEYALGSAETIPLESRSVDAAISSQAFHWFDLNRALAELRRVLLPGRTCTAFWNIRDNSTALLREYEALLIEHCPEYPVDQARSALARIQAHELVKDVRTFVLPHAQLFDREGLVGRAWSSSYVVHGVSDRRAFDAALSALFDRHQRAGSVAFEYDATALAFEIEL